MSWLLLAVPAVALMDAAAFTSEAHAQRGADPRHPRRRATGASSRRRFAPICKFNVGDAYDAGKVDHSIKALFATGLFADVRIDRDGAGVVITVVENPVINQVAFEGNSEVDKETLRERGPAQAALGVHARPRAGRRAAHPRRLPPPGPLCRRVEPKIIELDSNRVNLVFEINEGNATKVKAINFIGNRAFSDSQLRDIITTTQSGLFDFLKGTNIYDPDRHDARSRAAAPVLPEERLCRCARRRRPAPSSIATARASTSPSSSTRASCTTSARSNIEVGAAGCRCRMPCAASC